MGKCCGTVNWNPVVHPLKCIKRHICWTVKHQELLFPEDSKCNIMSSLLIGQFRHCSIS